MAQNPAPIRPRVADAKSYDAALRRAYLRPFVLRILERLANATGTTDVWRALDTELEALQARPQAGVPIDLIEAQIGRVEGYHRQRLIQTFRAALGVDVRTFLTRPAVAAFMAERIQENVSLIKTIPPRFHEGLMQRVGEEFAAAPFDQQRLRKMFRDEYQSSGYNLRRLTRDQTNKQVGGLSRLRHGQLGITRFIWRDVQDEREREECRQDGGNTYEWAKGSPIDGATPGQRVQCRCASEPALTQSDLNRLGARGTVATRKPAPELTPAQARKRFGADYKRQAAKHGVPKAEADLRKAAKDYDAAVAFSEKDYDAQTSRQRLDRMKAVTAKRKDMDAVRSVYVQKRLDAERAAWRDTFGRRKRGDGMDITILGRPGDDFIDNVTAASDDFRRMVHRSNLLRMGNVEVKPTTAGKG